MIMEMQSLLVLSVGEMDVLLLTILEYMLEPQLLCLGFRVTWDHVLELHHHPLLPHLHPHPHLQVLQVMVVDFPNGKETGTVMMKTTMTVATMMVEIVAVMMSTPHFVLPVNVLILILEVMIAVKMTVKTTDLKPTAWCEKKKGKCNKNGIKQKCPLTCD